MRAALLFLACTGCVLVTDAEWDKATDRDRDGHVAWQLGGDDCDDDDGAIHPGTAEVCGDNIDNDCDDAIDDDGSGNVTWYPDDDRDGHGIDAPLTGCVRPEGTLLHLDAGIDCNDAVAAIHPGAEEIWYDGVDQDCDGHDDYDQDFDGFSTIVSGGTDCDDLDDAVSPAATEVCGNHRDDDCDGTHNACAWTGDVMVDDLRHATIVWTNGPSALVEAAVGDTNGDGRDDIVLSGFGQGDVVVFEGPLSGTLLTDVHADVEIAMDVPTNIFGLRPAVGDLNGDGRADVILGNQKVFPPPDYPEYPVLRMFQAPLRASMSRFDADREYFGPLAETLPLPALGSTAKVVGDLDGDGRATWWSTYGDDGNCYLVEGIGSGQNVASMASTVLSGCRSVTAIPDNDADGVDELLVGASNKLYLVPGDAQGARDIAGEAALVDFGSSVSSVTVGGITDLDMDGNEDLVVSLGHPDFSFGLGVLLGPVAEFTETSPRIRITSPIDADLVGAVMDMNGDGFADLIVAALFPEIDGILDTRVAVFYGPLVRGDLDYFAADLTIDPSSASDLAVIALPADIDGDGFEDLVLSGLGTYVIYGAGR